MHCEQARDALILRAAGILDPREDLRLRHHLGRCNSCVEAARAEMTFVEELAALRGRDPVSVDVRARVLREIRDSEPGTSDRVSPPQFFVAAIAATVAALILGVGFRELKPAFSAAGRQLVSLTGTVLSLSLQFLEGVVAAGRVVLSELAGTSVALQSATPVLMVTTAVAYTAMASVIAWILAREFRRSARAVRSGSSEKPRR